MKKTLLFFFFILIYVTSFAQGPGSLDLSFNPTDKGFGAGEGASGTVQSSVIQSDGKIVIVGDFTSYDGVRRNGVARLNTDGTLDTSFDPGSGAFGGFPINSVRIVILQPDGKILIGGTFAVYNGASRNNIARLNSDGTLDTSFNPGSGASSTINSLSIQADGKILIGGAFTNYNGTGRSRVARLNPDGILDTSFDPGAGSDNSVNSVFVQSDGKILIVGQFTKYNNIGRTGIARLNPDGTLDTSFDPGNGTGTSNIVNKVSVQADGKILIVGQFTVYNGTVRNRIARLNPGGTLDVSFNPGTGADNGINSLSIQNDGKILIGGNFTNYNGTARNRIARLNSDGTLDLDFNVGTGLGGTLNTFSILTDGKIVIGGIFTDYNGAARNRIVRLNTDGAFDPSFNPGYGVNGSSVFSIRRQADGKILIGGSFYSYNNVKRANIARLNSNGDLDESFDPGTGANNAVRVMNILPNGKILVAGEFTDFNGTGRKYLVLLNSDGAVDAAFNSSGIGANGIIYSMAVQSDGKILIGGNFTLYNGGARNFVARLNADGSLDATFAVGSGINSSPRAIVQQPDGKILLGGSFTSYNGTTGKNRIIRLNTDGTLDAGFSTGTGLNNDAWSIVLQPDLKIVIGGTFTSYNGTTRNGVVRLNANGTLDATLDPAVGPQGNLTNLGLQSDGKILVGGIFTKFNNVDRKYLARLNPNGTLDPNFDPGTGPSDGLYSILVQPDDKILIGGNFTGYNEIGRNHIARILNEASSSQQQTINPINDIVKTYGDASFAPGATATSGLTVSYASADNSIAEPYQDAADGNKWKINIKKAGIVNITASQDGDESYDAATAVVFKLTINKATITGVTLDPKSFVYDGTAKSLVITGTEPTGTSVSYANNSLTNVGTQSVTATFSGANYNDLVLTANLSVTKATITGVTLDPKSFVYDGTAKSLVITGTEPTGTTVTYTNNSLTNVGTQSVTATVSGANYNDLVLTANLTVTKATITGVTLAPKSFVYDGTAKSLVITGTEPTGTNVSYANNSLTNVGTQSVTATVSGANYNDLVLTANLSVTKATITGVTLDPKSFVYDGTAKSLVITGTEPTGTIVSYANNSLTNVGTQSVTATVSGANYNDLVLTANLSVTKATITGVTLAPQSFVYDGTAKSLVITGTEPTGTTVTYTNNSLTNVGTQSVTATVSGANYNDLVLTANLSVTKAAIIGVTLAPKSFVYDGTAKSLVITGTEPTGTTVTYTNNSLTNVGTQSVTATVSGANYNDLVLTANLTVTKATITGVTLAPKSFVYDGTAKSLVITGTEPTGTNVSYANNSLTNVGTQSVTATVSGANYNDLVLTANLSVTKAAITGVTLAPQSFVYDGTAKSLVITGTEPTGTSVSYANNSLTNVGTQSVTATVSGANYNDLVLTANLSVTKATITGVTLTAQSFTYDGAAKSLTITGTRPTGTTISYANNGLTNVGTQQVTATVSGANYNDLILTANLSVTKAPLAITAIAKTKTYGDVDPVLNYTSTGLLGADLITGSLTRNSGEGVGAYTINTGSLTAGNNYNINFVPANLTVTKATLTVTAQNKQTCQGNTLPALTIAYSGFKFNDGEGSLITKPTVSSEGNSSSSPGDYALKPVGGVSANYNFNYNNGILSIYANPVASIASSKGSSVSKGETLTLTAAGGTSYQWSNSDGIIPGQNSAVLTIRPTVTTVYTVTVSNANGCSKSVNYTVGVRDDFQAVKANNILSPNGDGYNDLWKIENIDMYPNNTVSIFDKGGRLIFTQKGYQNTWDGTLKGAPLAENTYYYLIDFGNGKLKQKGFITIVKQQ